jgi:hypothetical protein
MRQDVRLIKRDRLQDSLIGAMPGISKVSFQNTFNVFVVGLVVVPDFSTPLARLQVLYRVGSHVPCLNKISFTTVEMPKLLAQLLLATSAPRILPNEYPIRVLTNSTNLYKSQTVNPSARAQGKNRVGSEFEGTSRERSKFAAEVHTPVPSPTSSPCLIRLLELQLFRKR